MASLTLEDRSIGLPTTPNDNVVPAQSVVPVNAERIAAVAAASANRWIDFLITPLCCSRGTLILEQIAGRCVRKETRKCGLSPMKAESGLSVTRFTSFKSEGTFKVRVEL